MQMTPVAVFLFNRPGCARQLLEAVSQQQPARLFIVADGPRDSHPDDASLCRASRAVFEHISWPCQVTRIYADKNMGCRNSIPHGLQQVFAAVEECIILEDDCIPQPSFFRFCTELLDTYRSSEQVMCISGHRVDGPNEPDGESYFFSKYPHIWGWATWRHQWAKFDLAMPEWKCLRETDWLRNILGSDAATTYWKRIFDQMNEGMDTWDYALAYAGWRHGMLSVRPKVSMITNIGLQEKSTHGLFHAGLDPFAPAREMDFPLIHPKTIAADKDTENRIEWVSYSGMDIRLLEQARQALQQKKG